MPWTTPTPPPGWYPAEGDPPGTQRYWDGTQWIGGPQPVAVPAQVWGQQRQWAGPELAGPWQRIGARLLDALIVSVIFVALALPFILSVTTLDDSVANDENDDAAPIFYLGLVLIGAGVAAVAYEVAFVAVKGATPGKMLVGIRVVSDTGAFPPGWGKAFGRWALNLLNLIPYLGGLALFVIQIVSLVFLFTDGERRTVFDRVAGTRVVKA